MVLGETKLFDYIQNNDYENVRLLLNSDYFFEEDCESNYEELYDHLLSLVADEDLNGNIYGTGINYCDNPELCDIVYHSKWYQTLPFTKELPIEPFIRASIRGGKLPMLEWALNILLYENLKFSPKMIEWFNNYIESNQEKNENIYICINTIKNFINDQKNFSKKRKL